MKKIVCLIVLVFTIAFPLNQVYAASPWTEGESYVDKTLGKLEFGVTNLLGGWTEIFNGSEREYEQGRNPFGALGIGLFNGIVYTVGGALHTVTFFIPIDVPLPNNGVQVD